MLTKFPKIKLQLFFTSFAYLLFLSNCLFAQDGLKDASVYKVGDRKEFWTWNLKVMPPEDIKLQATCRGIGENVYIFVSDDVWDVNVFQQDIEKIMYAFDHSTPEASIDKDKGIYKILTETFGCPPDEDDDNRIYFLISQLGEYRGHHFDGYFRFFDELEGKHSNRTEILYLDCDDPSDDYYLGIIAHEFQHLIHWQYDRNEAGWIGESLSEVAMIICGFYTDKKHVVRYLNNTDKPLVSKGHHNVSYGACLLWGTYIYEQLGIEFLGKLVREKENGIKGFQNTLKSMNIEDNFSTVFGDWLVANYVCSNPVNDERFKYKSIQLPITLTIKHFFSLPVYENGKVNGYAADYLKFSIKRVKDKKLRIVFKSDIPADFLVKIIRIYNDNLSNPEVEEVVLNEQIETFDVSDVGVDCREIVLVVSVLKPTKNPVDYSFSASLIPCAETVLSQ